MKLHGSNIVIQTSKMKRTFPAIVFYFSCATLFPQTKLIEHRSHSMRDFFSVFNEGNFGMAPERFVKNSKLDSVIILSDTSAVMVTSEYCTGMGSQTEHLWSAGRQIVIRHSLFTRKHTAAHVKKVLKRDYHFKNNIDDVVLIGFPTSESSATTNNKKDEQGKQKQQNDSASRKKNSVPVFSDGNNGDGNYHPPIDPIIFITLALFLAAPVLFAINFRKAKVTAAGV